MNKLRNALAVAVLTGLAAMSSAQAADLIVVNLDGANEGYNDNTVVAPVGGNPGTTKGAQRQYVAQYAAALWGSVLKSDQPIWVAAQFNPLGANVLGSAGSVTVHRGFTNVPITNVWYPAALADAISGTDLSPTTYDITSQFSSDYNFYYGLDDNTPAGQINFLDVVMHEFGHGLGFQNFENEGTGRWQGATNANPEGGYPDIFSVFTFDNTTGKYWTNMTRAERVASAINYGNVVFTGPNATGGAALVLGDRKDFRVSAPAAIAGNYAYNTVPFGAVLTPGFNGQLVLGVDAADGAGPLTTDGCSALTNAAAVAGKYVLLDRGTCAVTIKAKNVQNAGGLGLVVANNLAGSLPPTFSGVDATLTIPTVIVTQAAGASFKANLPAQVAFVIDPSKRQGADDQGRPRLYMPNPVESGSSGSHYDVAAMPNLLMEPAINDSLYSAANLDITPNLLADIGWQINTVGSFPVPSDTAKIGSPSVPDCDTGIPNSTQEGYFAGGSVQASNELCLISAKTRTGYYNCMDDARDRLVKATLLTTKQGNSMMACAKKVQSHQLFPLF